MKDGGPAFPTTEQLSDGSGGHYPQVCWGMSLRDWFAGQALTGELASQDGKGEGTGEYITNGCFALLSEKCYDIADAMLAEREKKEE